MSKVFGIDLGTTYSAIATLNENGIPEVIENDEEGENTLASAVYFQPCGDPVVGSVAKEQAIVEPDRVVQYIKREIGKPGYPAREFDGKTYDAIDISALILKRMKEYAEERCGEEVKDVIITCPAYFGAEEKMATKQAGEIAGFNVLDIINEPTAAALNYCSKEHAEDRKIMVYDLGGGTFDITLLDFSLTEDGHASIEVIASNGNDTLGGINWDSRLFDYICDAYMDETGMELDDDAKIKLRGDIEGIKKKLTKKDSHSFNIQSNGDSVRLEVKESKFREITQDLVAQTISLVEEVLSDSGMTTDDIDVMLLVGGSTYMPMIREAVEGMFPGKVRVEEPNLAVAKGAALKAAFSFIDRHIDPVPEPGQSDTEEDREKAEEAKKKAEELKAMLPGGFIVDQIGDVIPRAFGPAVISDAGDKEDLMINNLMFKGDKSPAEATKVYGTYRDNQSSVLLEVYENLSKDRDNQQMIDCPTDLEGAQRPTDPKLAIKKIGELTLPLAPGTPRGSEIEVTFKYSEIGLEVFAKDLRTGEKVNAIIQTNTGKSEDELEEATQFMKSINTASDF